LFMKLKTAIITVVWVFFVSFSYAQQYQITSVLKDKFFDKDGKPLTGKGVVIGDVDSGIDIFHPMLFFADGGEFDWTDIDEDGKITFGADGVDLNKDGKIEDNEVLRYLELRDKTWDMLPGIMPKLFEPDYDFLYIDVNGNKKRDFGPNAGFTEKDPAYGEPIFVALDANKNGRLDPGEKISELKTSKVRAVRERGGNVRRRGVDLIYCEDDSSGHGTGVAGLILGGQGDIQRMHGLAPDAEIVVATVRYNYTPRFVSTFPELVSFLRDEKVNILLFEDGEWMWEFMDGSSPEEQMVDEMAREGVTVIGGAGNFGEGNMMIMDTLAANKKGIYSFSCPETTEGLINQGVYLSFLWKDENSNLSFTIETPDRKVSPVLTTGADFIKVGSYNIVYAREVSPKGTVMFKIGCSKSDSGSVAGDWKINVSTDNQVIFRGYIVDVSQSWAGNSRWTTDSKVSYISSVMFPSTADSIMAIGAYVVNFGWFDKIGDLASYSSWGYNLDGKLGVDICAPGHTTFTIEKNLALMTFSGTSSAAPHVVGTAALLLQYNPSLTHEQVRQIILNSAKMDNFTGPVPNEKWGYGKLDTEAAIRYLIDNNNKFQ
jgi:subtilisin family serine protease